VIYEIRNYHFDPARFDEYKAWAQEKALPYLSKELDLLGFWVGDDAEVTGAAMDDMGSANITWIIRWPDRATRDAEFERIFTGEDWGEIFKDVPGGLESYKRMEAKFTENMLT